MASNFRKERLIPSDGVKSLKSFYDPLPKSGVKTMANMQTTVRVQYYTNWIVQNAGEELNSDVLVLLLYHGP